MVRFVCILHVVAIIVGDILSELKDLATAGKDCSKDIPDLAMSGDILIVPQPLSYGHFRDNGNRNQMHFYQLSS